MTKMLLAAVAALTLAACGDSAAYENTSPGPAAAAVDQEALASAVDRAIDEKALGQVVVGTAEGAARGAVEQAIQEVIPIPSQEMKAVGAAIDERALIEGIGSAIDRKAVADAVGGAAKDAAPAP